MIFKIFSLETEKIKNRNNLNYNRDRNHKADAYKSKTRNNSNRSNNSSDIKFKIIKRLELNDFLNNIKINRDKKNAITTSNELNFSTSGNQSDTIKMSRINTSINNKNYYEYFENSGNDIEAFTTIEIKLLDGINMDISDYNIITSELLIEPESSFKDIKYIIDVSSREKNMTIFMFLIISIVM